jgi:protein-tyrosine phosphatase
MATKLYWIDGPWPGRLAMASRPRGGDWLDDEINSWQQAGINAVLSLLSPDEEKELDLRGEPRAVKARGLDFLSFPIEDRQVPNSETEMASMLERLNADLSSGKNVVVHCRQGIGRSGLVAACLLVTKGLDLKKTLQQVSAARGASVPETAAQRNWIDHYAAILAGSK